MLKVEIVNFIEFSLYGTKYSRVDQVKFFKGYLPQTLLGPLLNTWAHIIFRN